MTKETAIKLFESKQVRTIWNADEEKWYFSIVDIVSILTDQTDHQGARNYWKVMKNRLMKEGNETVTNCNRLKLEAEDGKMRLTDVADTEQLLRLIQSIPSKKAEPFKQWLARVGSERIDEIEDPEKGFDRLMETYLRKGYSKEWINQRLKSIEVRKELTDEWDNRGVQKGQEYAILTDEITKAWSGFTTKDYKAFKDLKKENLRDNMTNLELVLNMLAEATTTEISKEKKPDTFEGNRKIARQGGTIAGNARREIEEKTGKKVISKLNARQLAQQKNNQISDKSSIPDIEI
jgi:hypothetical protein